MNFKTTYGLFGAFIALLAIAGAWLLLTGKPGEENQVLANAKALKLEAKDFDTLVVDRKGTKPEKLVFKRLDEKRWQLEQPEPMRVDSSAVDNIIRDLLSARREGKGDTPKNLKDLGLADPSLIVTLSRKEGQSYTVSFGNTTIGKNNAQVFVLTSDRPKDPIPVRASVLSSLLKLESGEGASAGDIAKSLSDFRSKELLLDGAGFNPWDAIANIKLTDGKTDVVIARQADNSWKYEKPENYGPAETRGEPNAGPTTNEPAAPTGVEPLATALAAIKPAGNDDVIDNVTDFAQYGLETDKHAGPKIEVTRKGDAKTTETLLIGKKDDASGKYFVRLAGEKQVAKVTGNLIEPIKKLIERPASLRDKQLLAFAPTGADGIDIKLPGEDKPLELRKLGDPPTWKLFESDGSTQPANTKTISDLLGALSGKPVKDFPDANATDAQLGFDRPSAEVTLYIGGILPDDKKDEKKDEAKDAKKDESKDKSKETPKADAKDKAAEKKYDKPPSPAKPKMKDPAARLVFGKRDKDLLFVRRILKDKDGKEQKADFAVSETLWPKVTRGRLEYVDPTLPSFVASTATKLDFTRGNENFVVEKQADKQPPWVIKLPADRADRPADTAKIDSILSDLASLNAVKLWSEKPSERELERYGLKVPRIKATVSVKDGDKTSDKVYAFGAETDDKSGYYAKQSDRDLVYVVSKMAVPGLESGELQDPVVFKLDANRVTSIKLTGWKDVVGQPVTRELERKGPGNWLIKGDDKLKANAPQCESFLNALSLIRAEKFVTHKSGAKDEHKLNVATGALEIQISVEGEKDPVTLTIGAPDQPDNKNYFAISNKLPGDVFLVPKGIFEAVKAKPGFFTAD